MNDFIIFYSKLTSEIGRPIGESSDCNFGSDGEGQVFANPVFVVDSVAWIII